MTVEQVRDGVVGGHRERDPFRRCRAGEGEPAAVGGGRVVAEGVEIKVDVTVEFINVHVAVAVELRYVEVGVRGEEV